MRKMSFAVVGSGWRAMFYVRAARHFPERFELKAVLCRGEERAAELRARGVPAVLTGEEVVRLRPDFIVVAVQKGVNFAVTKRWLELGFPVLAETPAGCEYGELCELWRLYEAGARIAVAEQYFRYPLIAAGLREVERGTIGTPRSVTLSLCHDYHAASVIRRMLMLERGRLLDFTVSGTAREYPVERTDSRFGPVTDGSVGPSARVTAELLFDDGKSAFYDFDGVQYHTFIRARHIDLRGERGQWYDTSILYSDAAHTPGMARLRAGAIPGYEDLMTPELSAIAERWNPLVHMETAQGEYAVATLLADMEGLVSDGREGYPLREALEDAYTWLLLSEALSTPGKTVASSQRPWN